MTKRLISCLMLLLLAGCAGYALVPPARTTVKGALSVEPAIAWNRFTPTASGTNAEPGPVEVWTLDGQTLDAVIFFAGIADGQPLLKAPPDQKEPYAPFRKGMTASDVMELFEATYTKLDKTTVATTRNLRPAKIGAVEGFRFEMSYVAKDEVDRELTAVGAISNDKLYLMVYRAPKIFYFDRYLPDFEKIISSAQIVKS